MPTPREVTIEVGVMLAIGLALAALGPFGSFAMGSFPVRLAYWVPMTLMGYAIVRPTVGASQLFAERLAIDRIAAALVAVAIAAAPATFVVLWWNGKTIAAVPTFERWFQLYVQVALVGVLVTGLFLLLERRTKADPALAPTAKDLSPDPPAPLAVVASPGQRFLDRLPPVWADRLVALEMEDHYVRAHGPGTSALILLRMRDAEAELATIDGMRIHRSWWVARRAVEKVLRDGRNYKLRLDGGLEAPVARDRVAALKAANWLG
ncbi:MAG: LytTR family transcriptional regulator DNA-binding domain-containing protein [Sphingomonas bacterium]|nr:LytTR family transcriptional regulator DNA-binding domain-containing protein [Sphingomonas bacterium]